MIIAAGGEFLDCRWTDDGTAFVCSDMHGEERLRLTWTGWSARPTIARLEIAYTICRTQLFPQDLLRNSQRQLDEGLREAGWLEERVREPNW